MIALVGLDAAGSRRELIGTGAILLAALGYAIGPMVLKLRLAGIDARAAMGASLGDRLAAARARCAGRPAPARAHRRRVGGVVVLGLLCTALAFVVFAALIREAGTSRSVVITYVNPVVAVGLGVASARRAAGRRAPSPGCCSSSPDRGSRPAVDFRRRACR